jgi:hypothetical protein
MNGDAFKNGNSVFHAGQGVGQINKGYTKFLKIGVGVFHSFMVHLVQCGKMTLALMQTKCPMNGLLKTV